MNQEPVPTNARISARSTVAIHGPARFHPPAHGHIITPGKPPQKVHTLLTSYYPYQRPKLSDPAHGTPRLQPRRDGRVRCSAWLAVSIMVNTLSLAVCYVLPPQQRLHWLTVEW